MEQQIRFCTTSDGVSIAYATAGEGPPLVLASGWISHLKFEWEHPDSRALWQELAKNHMLVRFDKRGTGLSDWENRDYTVEARVRDLEAVVDKLRLERFALMGWSEGGWTAAVYAAQHPEKVSNLVIYGSWHKAPWSREQVEPVLSLIRSDWGMASAALASLFVPSGDPSWLKFFTEWQRVAASAETAAQMLEADLTIDVTPWLEKIRAPTLILHRRDERVSPFRQAQEMAALIPDARLEPLDGDIHTIWWGDTKAILDAIDSFLREGEAEPVGEAPTPSGLVTILFTDMEGSTALTQRLGDAGAQELLRSHNSIVREALKAQDGAEIKHTGDGIMASFATASKALACATAIQTAFVERNETAEEPINVRIGLNAGEPVAEDEDLFGTAVQLAARVCSHAQPGQVLASNVVRELSAGKGFLFSDQGDVVLRGFEDPVRLYEVRGG